MRFAVHGAVRWLAVVVAVLTAYYLALYVILFGLVFGPFPKDLVEPTAGALWPALASVAAGLAAPHHKMAAALVVAVMSVALEVSGALPLAHLAGSLAGGIFGVASIAWWLGSRNRPGGTKSLRRALVVGAMCIVGFVVARYVDWPERPDDVPVELSEALGGNASSVRAFHAYDLGGYIDREWLWRFDATDEVVSQVVSGLHLHQAPEVADRFLQMPPHYWPRSRPAGAQAYQSEAFVADDRGRDGQHFFLLYDRSRNRVFVWYKNNF